jgi:predicted AAA+ superfamily ATPase
MAEHIERAMEPALREALLASRRKVVVLYGPRQAGKTTLLGRLRPSLPGRVESLNGDFADDQNLLRPERAALGRLVAGVDVLLIDEAQAVPEIGRTLKLLHDEFPQLRVLATGSSSLDLARHSGEPLTGRQRVLVLYPVAWCEQQPSPTRTTTIIEHGLVLGSYPEVLTLERFEDKVAHLRQLVADYLLKDVLAQVQLPKARLHDLLRLLALQLGSEVSLAELATGTGLDAKTVGRYLDLLEDAFVIVQLRGFSRNLRKEIAKARKIYFLDLGVRNAVIQAFQPLSMRTDVGALWENWLVVERIKRNSIAGIDARYHFWRTHDQKEIDLVEEHADGLFAYEFKWGPGRARIPRLWTETYPDSRTSIVTRDDVNSFLDLPA